MENMENMEYILLAILILVILIAIYVIYKIFSVLKFFKNEEIKEIYDAYKDLPETPKSLSGMDSIYAPLIKEDFPEINLDELKIRAKTSLVNIFNAIENKDIKIIGKASNLVKTKVEKIISDQKKLNQKEIFSDINFHNIVISKYENKNGYLSIVLQLALEFYHYISQNEEIINGSKEKKQQERFQVSFAYIQDIDKIDENDLKAGVFGQNCPNCAAPIKTIGQKYCEYCGSSIIGININNWIMIDYLRV